jgi:hypothetical protein
LLALNKAQVLSPPDPASCAACLTHAQGANGVPWSLIAHAAASNLKSTAPCLVQDLCNNYPSVLFDSCGRRACRRISVGYCLLSSTFFRALLTSQTSLLSLKDLILLDCITDAPPELLHKVYVSCTLHWLTVFCTQSSSLFLLLL